MPGKPGATTLGTNIAGRDLMQTTEGPMIITSSSGNKDACGCRCGCEPQVHECIAAADAILAQTAAFIEDLEDASYSRPCALASNGTIGKHIRHCLDHFTAALAGVLVGGGGGGGARGTPIDYDHRDRDVPMETCTRAALDAVASARADLRRLTADRIDSPVTVRVMVSADGRTIDLGSTLGRELAFAAHHALHHHAMIKFIADSFGLATPEGFGKAPSTVHHERRISATLSR